jgi:hypothetical protein
VVLDRDLREIGPGGTVLLEVGRSGEREPAGRGLGQVADAVGDDRRARDAAILGLVVADDEDGVVDAGGDREGRESDQVRAGRAVVGRERDGLVEELERVGALVGALVGVDRAGEDGVDLALRIVDAGVGLGFVGRVDDHVGGGLVPVLAELATADTDDGDLVANRFFVRHGGILAGWASGRAHRSGSGDGAVLRR